MFIEGGSLRSGKLPYWSSDGPGLCGAPPPHGSSKGPQKRHHNSVVASSPNPSHAPACVWCKPFSRHFEPPFPWPKMFFDMTYLVRRMTQKLVDLCERQRGFGLMCHTRTPPINRVPKTGETKATYSSGHIFPIMVLLRPGAVKGGSFLTST